MKLESAAGSAVNNLSADSRQLIQIIEKSQWLDSLVTGQTLKGRIMRQYAEGQYGVYLGGRERVVDSSVPLSVGELLHGKVVGVSDNSVSIRIVPHHEPQLDDVVTDKPKPIVNADSVNNTFLTAWTEQYGISFNQAQAALLTDIAQQFEDPEMAIKVAFYLAKLGFPFSVELIKAMTRRVVESSLSLNPNLDNDIPQLIFDKSKTKDSEPESPESVAARYVGDYYFKCYGHLQTEVNPEQKNTLTDITEEFESTTLSLGTNPDLSSDSHTKQNAKLHQLLSQVLNIQTDATFQHRFETLPIMINGRTVEFDVAFFDHAAQKVNEKNIRNSHLKFSLSTEFGNVVLDAHVLDNRIDLKVQTDSQKMANVLKQHHPDLCYALQRASWVLDHADYDAELDKASPSAIVIDHVLRQGSLNRVF
jgi:hypothetical protein